MNDYGIFKNDREEKKYSEKPIPLSLCPPHTQHEMAWD
jgi:hypothetical protein